MPRHDRYSDEMMSRERSDHRERGHSRHEERDRGMMFDRNRDRDRERDHSGSGRIGGWGGLMGEEPGRERMSGREHGRQDKSRHEEREHSRDRERGWGGGERTSRSDEDHRFGPDDYNRGIPMDETQRLIASNKVEGTPVYDRHGDKLGSIHNFMVDKRKGQVVYAVLKHGGGFLGLNERYYPLEWNQLTYDTDLGGYHARLDEEDLKSFGSFDSEGRWHSRSGGGRSDRDRESRRESSMSERW